MSSIYQKCVEKTLKEIRATRSESERFLNWVCFKYKKTEANPWQIFTFPAMGDVNIERMMKGRFINARLASRPIFLLEEQDIVQGNPFRVTFNKYEHWEHFIADEKRVLELELEQGVEPYKGAVKHTIKTYIPKLVELSQHLAYQTPKPPPRKPRKEDQLKLFY